MQQRPKIKKLLAYEKEVMKVCQDGLGNHGNFDCSTAGLLKRKFL